MQAATVESLEPLLDANGDKCEWYHICSARSRGGSQEGSTCNTPRRLEAAPPVQSSMRLRLPALPTSPCAGGPQSDSRASSVTTAGSRELQNDHPRSCVGSEAGSAVTPWEKRVSLVDEQQAEAFKLQWSFVRESIEGFSSNIAGLRDEFQILLRDVVAEELEKQLRPRVSEEVENQLASSMDAMQQVLADEMHDVRGMLSRKAAEAIGPGESLCHDSLNLSVTSELPNWAEKAAALEQQFQSLHSNSWVKLEERISGERDKLANTLAEVTTQLHSCVERESDLRSAADKETSLLVSNTAQAMQQALDLERQERQCMCNLVAISSQERGAGTAALVGADLSEVLRGVFASVGSLQEALGREAELRVSGHIELQKLVVAKTGWQAEIQKVWTTLNAHAGDLQLEKPARSTSPSHRHEQQRELLSTESSRKGRSVAPVAEQNQRQRPMRVSRSDSVASLPTRSPSRGLSFEAPPRSGLPRREDAETAGELFELAGPAAASSRLTRPS